MEQTPPEVHTPSHRMIAAIDFGTTFSGWACWCIKEDFDVGPSNIYAKDWNNGCNISTKTPTTVLIAPDGKTFVAFGYEAEDEFAKLCAKHQQKGYYYFSKFKMLLHNKLDINKGTLLEDAFGECLPAKHVFKHAIKYLTDDLLAETSRGAVKLQARDILWVLTVPAIWNEMAKRFMREAAEEAGIPSDCLKIALEPEAASLYCKMMTLEKKRGDLTMSSFEPGAKYIVVDAGGGTVDVSVHEVLDDGNLRELYKASGGAWGGTTVDDAYKDVLVKIFGRHVFAKFRDGNRDDYIDIFRHFEVTKRGISKSTQRDIKIILPATLVNTYTDETGSSLEQAVLNSAVSKFISPEKGNKLIIKATFMKQLFSVAIEKITKHITELLRLDVVKGVKTIIMVGGLSDSNIVHETVKLEFPTLNVVVPPEAALSVIKGAVVFGYKPTVITERISPYTYGIEQAIPFQHGVHPSDKLRDDGKGEPLCTGSFHKIIECGRQIKVNKQIRSEHNFTPTATIGLCFSVYGSTKQNPTFVTDEGCFFVGEFLVKFPDVANPDNLKKQFRLYMVLGGTEIRVIAKDVHTNETHRSQFKLKDV